MNKDDTSLNDDLRPEYDFSTMRGGVRGKHLIEYRAGTNLVRIAPDVAAAFPTEEAVNHALRQLMGADTTAPEDFGARSGPHEG